MLTKKFTAAMLGLFITTAAGAKSLSPVPFNAFDGAAPDARAIAMGGAFAAVAGEASAVYYNPAGLHNLPGNYLSVSFEAARQSELTSAELFSTDVLRNQSLVFVALASPSGSFSWRPVSDLTARRAAAGIVNDEIKINAYTVSVSNEGSRRFFTGLNLTYLNGRIGTAGTINGAPYANLADGNGFTADFGVLYIPVPQIRFAAVAQNLFGVLWWDDFEEDILPFTARAGFAFQIAEFTTFASDVEKHYYRKDGASEVQIVHFGLEQNIAETLMLRAGMFGEDLNDKRTTHYTAGIGYRQNGYLLSLALDKYALSAADVFRYVVSLDLPL